MDCHVLQVLVGFEADFGMVGVFFEGSLLD